MGKSGKQRRTEIRTARMKKALANEPVRTGYTYVQHCWELEHKPLTLPRGAVLADVGELAHNNTYGFLPLYYVDRVFDCIDCRKQELWTAKQQKWWYEFVKGHIDSQAVRCKSCRRVRREQRRETRNIHFSGLIEKHGLAEAARLLGRCVGDLRQWQAKNGEEQS